MTALEKRSRAAAIRVQAARMTTRGLLAAADAAALTRLGAPFVWGAPGPAPSTARG